MRSPSIEYLYTKIEKLIRLATSYSEIPKLDFIIKACRLKPYNYIWGQRSRKLMLHRWWVDEFGNSFKLVKKKAHITYNDLKLNRDGIVCTDMYCGLSLDRVAKISKLMHVCVGKDEDLYQECCLLTFLGIDNHLRSYLYWYGEWQQVSPLLLGMTHLKLIANSTDIKYFRQISNSVNMPIPCVSGQAWLSYLPSSQDFLDILRKHGEIIYHVLEQ